MSRKKGLEVLNCFDVLFAYFRQIKDPCRLIYITISTDYSIFENILSTVACAVWHIALSCWILSKFVRFKNKQLYSYVVISINCYGVYFSIFEGKLADITRLQSSLNSDSLYMYGLIYNNISQYHRGEKVLHLKK